jgi:hypothetical protein
MENNPADNDQIPLRPESQVESSKEVFNFLLWLRRFTIVSIPITIYQIVASAIHLSDCNSSLNKIEVVESSLSFVLILILLKRVISAFDSNNHLENLLEAGTKEQNLYFISTVFLAIAKIVIVLNVYIQSPYVSEYLTAIASNTELWKNAFGNKTLIDVSTTLLNLRIAYIFFDVFLTVYFLLVARGLFYHISNKKQAISSLINSANLVAITFALIAICRLQIDEKYQAYPYLKQLVSAITLNRLFAGLISLVVLCFVSWIVNYKRWKAGYFIFSVVFLVLGIYLATTAGFTYRGTRAVRSYYLTNWHDRLEMVHENELLAIGCPSKYSSDSCSISEQVNKWETTKTVACLNSACAGLLSQLYSNEFLSLSNEAILALAFLTIVAGGFYYFWYIVPREPYIPSQTDFIWLILLVLVTIVVTLTYKLSNFETIYEFTDKKGHF